MKRLPRPLLEGLGAGAAGLALYGAAAGIEIALGAGPTVSAILEEFFKAVLILGAGWLGIRARAEHPSARQARSLALGAARGLSLGLVAITIFAGAENLAYLIVFPEAGILGRLLWSLPVHLVAALAEALGATFLFRKRGLTGVSIWLGALAFAMAWHAGANLLVSGHLAAAAFTAGTVIANLLFFVLLSQFLKQAYLGGFLHGAD